MFLYRKTYHFLLEYTDMEDMTTAKAIRERINQIEPGYIFGLKDFNEFTNSQLVILELSRLSKKGKIKRLSKGKYYIPKSSKFGELTPPEWQILDNIIKQSGGYFAGAIALNRIGVTTQIPSEILIRGARSTRNQKVGNLRIKFQSQGLKNIDYKNAAFTDIIEALRLIKKTPDGNTELTLNKIKKLITNLSIKDLDKLMEMANQDRPFIRALIGALIESINPQYAQKIKIKLNPVTTYKLNIKESVLPNKKDWGII